MSQAAPFFSILLPTFNRASTIPLAIKSVLNQTYTDFELVISNGGSTDDTDEAVARFDDGRVRYFTSPHRLSMAENYEKSISLARGVYIIFFSDDDAFVPSMLARLHNLLSRKEQTAKMVSFPFAQFYPDDDADENIQRNSIRIPAFSMRVQKIRSADDLKRMSGRFGLSEQPHETDKVRPLIGNVVLLRSVVEELQCRVESIFATIPVDGYFISLVLGVIEEYFIYDEPLLVWSKWAENASISKSSDLRRHYERLLNGKELEQVPLKFALPMNCAANSILQASIDLGNRETIPVDWAWYYKSMYEYLISLHVEGVDTSEELNELVAVMKKHAVKFETNSANARKYVKLFSRQSFKKNCPSLFRFIKSIAGDVIARSGDDEILGPDQTGVDNVLEAARFLESGLPGVPQ